MNTSGLTLCSRYAYPPNALSLCGPNKQNDLSWYVSSGMPDRGTKDILTQFQTLYPYLKLIASQTKLEPFDPRVVEAYWIGNELLENISYKSYIATLSNSLSISYKLPKKSFSSLFDKISLGGKPNHAFHVLNVFRRTGSVDEFHTVQTMEACLINVGTIESVTPDAVLIRTRPLRLTNNSLFFDSAITRTITTSGKQDPKARNLKVGDQISYHWGRFVEKLTPRKTRLLIRYTIQALSFANRFTSNPNEKNYLYFR